MTTIEDKIKSQEKLVDRLQSKLDFAPGATLPHEIKDVAVALQAAIDGLVALKTLAQTEAEMMSRDAAYAEFQAKRQRGK